MKLKVFLWAALALCVFAASTAPSLGFAADEAELECKVGYNNKVYMMNWMPVIVDIQAGAGDIDGDLVVLVNGRSGKPNEYRSAVQLSAGSKKRVTIYVMMETLQKSFTIELVGKNNKVLAKQTVKNVQQGEGYVPLLGLFGTGEGLSSFLDINKAPEEPAVEDLPIAKPGVPYVSSSVTVSATPKYQNYNLQPVSISKDTFPSRPEAIDGFSLIICNSGELGELDERQTDTLKGWLDRGGVLLASAGPDAKSRIAAINAITGGSLAFLGTEEAEVGERFEEIAGQPLTSGAKLVAARIEGAEPIYELDGIPLAYKVETGRGAVVITAFDMALEPLADYTDLPGLIMGMLGQHVLTANPNPYYREMDYVMMNAANALGNISEMKTPSLWVMSAILLIYTVVAAPVTYIILKRKDRREWMWLAVPVWAVLFTISIYAYGFATKGTDYVSNTVATLTIDENKALSRADVYTGVFFPRRESAELSIDTNRLVRPISSNYYYNYNNQNQEEQKARAETIMRQDGGDAALVLRDVSMWTMKSVYYQTGAPEINEMSSYLYVENGEIKGTVTNTTGMRLEKIGLLFQNAFQTIEALDPGESADVSLPLEMTGYYGGGVYDLISTLFPYNYNTGMNQEDPALVTRRDFMHQWANTSYNYNINVDSGASLSLVCWTDEVEFPSMAVNGERPIHQGTQTLLSVKLPVNLTHDGSFETMGAGINFTMMESLGVNNNGSANEMYATGGSKAKFAIDFSEYIDKYELESVTVNWQYLYGMPWLKIYNYDTGDWEAASFPYPITDERYCEGSVIMLSMEVPDGGDASFRLPTLSLKGKERVR